MSWSARVPWKTALDDGDILAPSEALRKTVDCYEHRVCLTHGTEVRLRLLRVNDREALTELYGRLGEHSRYQRFFACPTRLPAAWADALLEQSPRRLGL